MNHPYKTQLRHNLEKHYNRPDWGIKNNFLAGKDEIIFILPETDNTAGFHEKLYDVLSVLPEIEHPIERVMISFCHADSSGYCSRLINPNTQDEINLALLGHLPKRSLRPEEIR